MKLLNKKKLQLDVSRTLSVSQPPSTLAIAMSNLSRANNSIPTSSYHASAATTAGAQLLPSDSTTCCILPTRDRITRIVDGIYIGNYTSACDKAALKSEGITHIVNCSPSDCPNKFEDEITYLNINIQDNWKTDLFLVIYAILDFVTDALHLGASVLVHCNQGISRSSSIVIAYLIYTERIDASQALCKVKEKYPFADPNVDFQIQLNEMYLEVIAEQMHDVDAIQSSSMIAEDDRVEEFETEQQQQLGIENFMKIDNSNNNKFSCKSPCTCSPLSSASRSSSFSTVIRLSSNGMPSVPSSQGRPNRVRGLSSQLSQSGGVSRSSSCITVSTPSFPQVKLDYDVYLSQKHILTGSLKPSSRSALVPSNGANIYAATHFTSQPGPSSSCRFSSNSLLLESQRLNSNHLGGCGGYNRGGAATFNGMSSASTSPDMNLFAKQTSQLSSQYQEDTQNSVDIDSAIVVPSADNSSYYYDAYGRLCRASIEMPEKQTTTATMSPVEQTSSRLLRKSSADFFKSQVVVKMAGFNVDLLEEDDEEQDNSETQLLLQHSSQQQQQQQQEQTFYPHLSEVSQTFPIEEQEEEELLLKQEQLFQLNPFNLTSSHPLILQQQQQAPLPPPQMNHQSQLQFENSFGHSFPDSIR